MCAIAFCSYGFVKRSCSGSRSDQTWQEASFCSFQRSSLDTSFLRIDKEKLKYFLVAQNPCGRFKVREFFIQLLKLHALDLIFFSRLSLPSWRRRKLPYSTIDFSSDGRPSTLCCIRISNSRHVPAQAPSIFQVHSKRSKESGGAVKNCAPFERM